MKLKLMNEVGTIKHYSYMPENGLTKNGYKPNDVLLNDLKRVVIVLGYKSKTGQSYSLNTSALFDATAAVRSGRRTLAFVALADERMKDEIPHFVNLERAEIIEKRLRYVPTRAGTKFDNDFWWVDGDFNPDDSGLGDGRTNVNNAVRI